MRSAKGSVYKMGNNRWRVMVEAGHDPDTGKRVRRSKVVHGSRRDAEAVKAVMLVEEGDTEVARSRMTVQEYFDGVYLPHCKKTIRETTWSKYESQYRLYLAKPLGHIQLVKIKPAHVRAVIERTDGDGKKVCAYKLMRQMMRYALRMDLIDSDPTARVEPPKRKKYKFEVLDAHQAREYIRHFRSEEVDRRAETAVLLALGGALTRSEMCGLEWDDVTQDGAVMVDNGITTVHGRQVDDDPKNQFRVRTVHLPASVAARLNELRGEGRVFQNEVGGQLDPDKLSKLYRDALKTLPEGVPRIPMKNLRHTSLTLALESGTDLLAVSRRAGHASVSTTATFYIRPHESVDIAAAQRLDSLL